MPGVATPCSPASQARWQGGVVEGPTIALIGGQYLLFYSANNWQTSAYAVGWPAVPAGLDRAENQSTAPLLASQPAFSGPGGPSVFADGQGHLRMAFHAWRPGAVGFPNSRVLFIRPLTVAGGAVTIGS